MGFHDYLPMFCDECETAYTVMMDQNDQIVIACTCLEGRRELEASNQAWVRSNGSPLGGADD